MALVVFMVTLAVMGGDGVMVMKAIAPAIVIGSVMVCYEVMGIMVVMLVRVVTVIHCCHCW